MMRILVYTLLVSGLFAGALQAQVSVRSGEHPGFTRLVFYFDQLDDWKLGRTSQGYGLRIDKGEVTFDLGDVFAFIPRSRILEINEKPDGLDIVSNCECYANAYEYREGILVLDIRSGPPPSEARFETPLSEAVGQEEDNDTLELPIVFAEDQPKGTTSRRQSAANPLANLNASDTLATIEFNPTQEGLLERRLAEQFGRALSDGILTQDEKAGDSAELVASSDPVHPGLDAPHSVQDPNPAKVPSAQPEDHGPGQTTLSDLPHVRVHSAMDVASGNVTRPGQNGCLDPRYFSFAQGAEDTEVMSALVSAREAFLDDLTQPSDHSVKVLARAYLALGFGAEATQVLQKFPTTDRENAVLKSLADLIDHPAEGGDDLLRSQVSCDGDGAVWGLLAHGKDRPTEIVNDKAIVRTVSGMPLYLRQHLVPTVSERLRRLGLDDTAAAVRDTVLRATDGMETELAMEMVLADMGTNGKPSSRAPVSALEAAAKPNSPVARQAVTLMLNQIQEAGDIVPDALMLQVASELHSSRGSAESQELLNAYMAALGRRGLHGAAEIMLTRLDRSRFSDAYDLPNAAEYFLNALVEDAQSGAFVVSAVAFGENFDIDSLPRETRNNVAARFKALNLDEQAYLYQGVSSAVAANGFADQNKAGSSVNTTLASFENDEAGSPSSAERRGQLAWARADWQDAEERLPDGPRRRLAHQLAGETALDVAGNGGEVAVPVADLPAQTAFAPSQVTLAALRDILNQSETLRQDLASLGLTQEN